MKRIKLTKGKVAIVDDADHNLLCIRRWHAVQKGRTWYAASRIKGHIVYMHRLLLSPPIGIEIDHVDDDGLNNSRSNIRLCNRTENNRRLRRINKTGFRGVDKHGNGWRARIRINKKPTYIGFFKSAKEAGLAYDKAAKIYFGNFCRLNFQ